MNFIFHQDAFVLCRVTKRNGWGVECENVGEEVSLPSENADDSSKHTEDLATTVAPEKSSNPSKSVENIEAWFADFTDPHLSAIPTLGEVENEPQVSFKSNFKCFLTLYEHRRSTCIPILGLVSCRII